MFSTKKVLLSIVMSLVVLVQVAVLPLHVSAAISNDIKSNLDKVLYGLDSTELLDVMNYILTLYTNNSLGVFLDQDIQDDIAIDNPIKSNTSESITTIESAANGNSTMCEYVQALNKDLKEGSADPQVRVLQKMLNTLSVKDRAYLPVAASNEGSIGKETVYFGRATEFALSRWQDKNVLAADRGVLDLVTRKALTRTYCGGLSAQESSDGGSKTDLVGIPSCARINEGADTYYSYKILVTNNQRAGATYTSGSVDCGTSQARQARDIFKNWCSENQGILKDHDGDQGLRCDTLKVPMSVTADRLLIKEKETVKVTFGVARGYTTCNLSSSESQESSMGRAGIDLWNVERFGNSSYWSELMKSSGSDVYLGSNDDYRRLLKTSAKYSYDTETGLAEWTFEEKLTKDTTFKISCYTDGNEARPVEREVKITVNKRALGEDVSLDNLPTCARLTDSDTETFAIKNLKYNYTGGCRTADGAKALEIFKEWCSLSGGEVETAPYYSSHQDSCRIPKGSIEVILEEQENNSRQSDPSNYMDLIVRIADTYFNSPNQSCTVSGLPTKARGSWTFSPDRTGGNEYDYDSREKTHNFNLGTVDLSRGVVDIKVTCDGPDGFPVSKTITAGAPVSNYNILSLDKQRVSGSVPLLTGPNASISSKHVAFVGSLYGGARNGVVKYGTTPASCGALGSYAINIGGEYDSGPNTRRFYAYIPLSSLATSKTYYYCYRADTSAGADIGSEVQSFSVSNMLENQLAVSSNKTVASPGEDVTLTYSTHGYSGCKLRHSMTVDGVNMSQFNIPVSGGGTQSWVASGSSNFTLKCDGGYSDSVTVTVN